MAQTPKLLLELLANSAGNQVNANTTFSVLDQLVMPRVVDKDLSAPPGSPADGSMYIVAGSATGDWSGKEGNLAWWLDSAGVWTFLPPELGMSVRVLDELDGSGLPLIYAYSGSAWVQQPSGSGSFTGGTLTSALNEAPATTLASASTVDVGAESSNTVIITGTTTITSLGTIADGAVRRLEFQGALILTHNATSLILPTGANITTAAGDAAEFRSLGSGNWRCVSFTRANGQALATPGGGFTGGTLSSALNEAPLTTLASASTIDIGAEAANTINISGTTTITSLGTIASGAKRKLVFQGVLTLTHNATSLILPTGANITTAAGDSAEFTSLGSGNWRCTGYLRANGQALATAGGGFTGGTLTSALNEAPAVTLASAGTVNIGAAAANTINVTGTTTITAFDSIADGAVRRLIFAAALTLTHNGTSLILPGAANITTAAGDCAEFVSLGGGNWKCTAYRKASGNPVALKDVSFTGSIGEQVYALSGTTPSLDPANGTIQTWTLTANSSPTDGLSSGQSMTLMIDDGSSYLVTWPTMTWVTGSPPALATTGYTAIALWKVGSDLYGSYAQ